jgi:hypothetical protein
LGTGESSDSDSDSELGSEDVEVGDDDDRGEECDPTASTEIAASFRFPDAEGLLREVMIGRDAPGQTFALS